MGQPFARLRLAASGINLRNAFVSSWARQKQLSTAARGVPFVCVVICFHLAVECGDQII